MITKQKKKKIMHKVIIFSRGETFYDNMVCSCNFTNKT